MLRSRLNRSIARWLQSRFGKGAPGSPAACIFAQRHCHSSVEIEMIEVRFDRYDSLDICKMMQVVDPVA
jgi:hypothetical protein